MEREAEVGAGAPEFEVIPPASALAELARLLYETMERLAPGSGEFVEWGNLTQWQRDLFLNCVEALLDEHDLIRWAIKLADDDVINGRSQEHE